MDLTNERNPWPNKADPIDAMAIIQIGAFGAMGDKS